jgi:ankyrin repeat protein
MASRGALKRKEDVRAFLEASVESGFPDLVTLALQNADQLNIVNESGVPLLSRAAGSFARDDDPVRARRFDSAHVVQLLAGAGANPNARDAKGNTPLFEANSADVTRALIKAGADPNARNAEGKTPLFGRYFDEPKKVLLKAGTDVGARDKYGRTALFYQDQVAAIRLLTHAGADVNATDSQGNTPLEIVDEQNVALALVAAGATLPTDPKRLAALIQKATNKKWTELLRQLKHAAPHAP